MDLILLIIIVALVWTFMIAPFIKIYRAVNNAQKNAREHFRKQQAPKHPEPEPAKKKIDPTVGEYVQFTEVSETRTTPEGDTTTTTEQQVTDVTWEDL